MISLKSVRSKIVIFAILATLLPSLGLGLMSFNHNQDVIQEKLAHELRALTHHARREFDLWMKERVLDVRALSSSSVVIDGLAAVVRKQDKHTTSPALTLYLHSVQKRLPPLLELTVVDPNSRILASSATAPTEIVLPETWPPHAISDGVIITPAHWDTTRTAPTLSIAMPVLSINNEILGALVAVLDLRTLQPLLKANANLPPGEVLLLDANGQLLIGTTPELETVQALPARLLQRLHQEPGQLLEFKSFDLREVIGMADTPQQQAVTIVAQKGLNEVYATWSALRNQLLILIGALSLLVGLLALQIGRSIVVPLKRLISATEQIAGGNLGVQLPAAREDEIGRLTRVFNQMTDSLRRGRADVEAASETLQQQNQLLERLSITDSLTGLYNRRKLTEILSDQLARYQRHHRSFSLLLLDIDHFKALNDTHGHLVGDEVIAEVANILVQDIRSVDFAARYGGEEFIVVLIETNAETALETAERIRAKVESAGYGSVEQRITVTVSIGVAECHPDDVTAESVIARADEALYEAKNAGRNRVHSAA